MADGGSGLQIIRGCVEDCTNGIDDDNDGLIDCADPQCCDDPGCFGTESCTVLTETILAQEATLNNVNMEVVGIQNFACTFNSASLELVRIDSGAFKDKGFFKGTCQITCEGASYTGEWKGVIFRKPPESEDRNFYLKGAITGGIAATVEGDLTESVPGSENYDKYQAAWQVGRLGGVVSSFTLNVNGTLSYQGETPYNGTNLLLVRDNIETTDTVDYKDVGDLSIVLTHLRVVSPESNPYLGEGFSLMSYNSQSGAGQGWTYNRLLFRGMVEMKGLFSSPLYGIASATLDDTSIPRTMSLSIKRIDEGVPPMADLEVKTWGPERVSPGQTVDYMVEYRNDGTASAEDTVVVLQLPSLAQYISSTNEGIYRWETHEAFWKLGTVLPGQRGILSARVYFPWGLAGGIPQLTLAKYGTSSTEKDFFLHPDREPLFDLQDYLAYQPLEISPEDVLTPEEFANELASNARFNDLHQYAIELGYSDNRISAKIILNDASTFIVALMSNPSNKVLFLTKANDRSLLGQYTETGISIFDREGGMSWDLDNDSINFQGKWAQLDSSLETLRTHFLGKKEDCPDHKYHFCLSNCLKQKTTEQQWLFFGGAAIAVLGAPFGGGLWGWGLFVAGAGVSSISTYGIGDIKDVCENRCRKNPCGPEFMCQGDLSGCYYNTRGSIVAWVRKCNKLDGTYSPLQGDVCDSLRETCNKGKCERCNGLCSSQTSNVTPARDPNIKYGPSGAVEAGQTLNYKVEFENEGEGIAFGVYFTDTLDEDLDESTRVIGEVKDVKTGLKIGEPGTYNPATRTITWFVSGEGEVGPKQGGYAEISVNVKSGAANGTEIINYGTVYFPSVPEETRTNAIVSRIPLIEDCSDGIDNDEDGLTDCEDPECSGSGCVEVCDDDIDNDGDGFVDCADTDCPPCPEICDDGLDNDRDGLIDCDDPDCTCCDSTNYSKGTSSISFKGGRKDGASLQMCVNRAFCDALRAGVKELTLRLDDCNEITIPGNRLRSDRGKTRFSANSSTYKLVIDCKKGVMSLRLGKAALKACVSNPVKTCVSIKDGPCLCAESKFAERRDRKGNLIGLSLNVKSACPR